MLQSEGKIESKMIARMPKGLSFEEAAHLPSLVLSADYVLGQTANLHHAQTILIQDANTALGLMLVQYARNVGAKVYAVASHESKEYLESVGAVFITKTTSSSDFMIQLKHALEENEIDVWTGPMLQHDSQFSTKLASLLKQNAHIFNIDKDGTNCPHSLQELRPDIKYH